MQNNELIKKAYEYFEKGSLRGLYAVYDIGDCIVAFGGNPNIKIYGCRSIEVNKISGDIKLFCFVDEQQWGIARERDSIGYSRGIYV